ncbi:MAG: eukaryotic-like serine/threonine-protein kinase [Thermomicrobiales bacterium]|jgi:hypothetical protein|nr:eukaryotic-like serine/threonine-protein kinase [Thermomicrobiales bacterium]
MSRSCSGKIWRGLILLIVLIAQPTAASTQPTSATPEAADGDALLERWRNEAMSGPAQYGPADGTIPHLEDNLGIVSSGVRLQNFYARAWFHNPYQAADQGWDYGFRFRVKRSDEYRVFVSSEGEWELTLGPDLTLASGRIEGLDLAADTRNLVEIGVSAGVAVIAVNAAPAVVLDVSQSTQSGEVQVASGFVGDRKQPGAATPYDGFAVWPLDGAQPEPAPDATTLVAQGRRLRGTAAPLSGPAAGALVLPREDDRWIATAGAGVTLRDCYVHVRIRVPEQGDDQPWDVGLTFRDLGFNDQWRLVIVSDGSWYMFFGLDTLRAAGELADFEAERGMVIDLELAVFGSRAAFAVDGSVVAAVDLTGGTEFGNVLVGSPFFSGDKAPFSVVQYDDFAVWSEEESSGVALPAPNDGTTVSEQDVRSFAQLLQAAESWAQRLGPDQGSIDLDTAGIGFSGGTLEVQDFVARARFFNPFDAVEHPWDYGFAFRMRKEGDPPTYSYYALFVSSELRWYLVQVHPDGKGNVIQQGVAPGFDLAPFSYNVLTMAAVDDEAFFAVNGAFVGKLDVSSLKQPGRVVVFSGLLPGNDIKGGWTKYDNFDVWALAAATPQAEGSSG